MLSSVSDRKKKGYSQQKIRYNRDIDRFEPLGVVLLSAGSNRSIHVRRKTVSRHFGEEGIDDLNG